MEDFVLNNNLFDIYGSTLTDNQQDIFKLYYEENLSMQEIADLKKVSKAFVGKVIKESVNKLEQLENSFHLLEYKNSLMKLEKETNLDLIHKEIAKIINNI